MPEPRFVVRVHKTRVDTLPGLRRGIAQAFGRTDQQLKRNLVRVIRRRVGSTLGEALL
jgi:hypothetical protein